MKTTEGLTETEIEQNVQELLGMLARVAREKKTYICIGKEGYELLVDQGGVVTTKIDLCHGTAEDRVDLDFYGIRFMSSKWGRKPTAEEFDAAVAAQREKL